LGKVTFTTCTNIIQRRLKKIIMETINQKKSVLLGLKLINDWLEFQTQENLKQMKKLGKEIDELENKSDK